MGLFGAGVVAGALEGRLRWDGPFWALVPDLGVVGWGTIAVGWPMAVPEPCCPIAVPEPCGPMAVP